MKNVSLLINQQHGYIRTNLRNTITWCLDIQNTIPCITTSKISQYQYPKKKHCFRFKMNTLQLAFVLGFRGHIVMSVDT